MYESHEERYKEIAGNASDHVKQALAIGLNIFMGGGRGFADAIGGRLRIVSADVFRKADEPEKLEGKLVCEIDVEHGTHIPPSRP